MRKAIDYAVQIAKGLAAAHEKGIIHRDLKPENLFLTNDGRVKILDFGLAKLTQTEAHERSADQPPDGDGTSPASCMGTLGYMSPEQVKGKPADQRSDLFAFGAILYEMLSGQRAFHRESAAETMSAILREEPPDLSATNKSVQPGLERIVRHCLEKNPEERFYSARDVAFDLEALSGSVGTPRRRPASSPPGRHAARRGRCSPGPSLATALVCGLLGLVRDPAGRRPSAAVLPPAHVSPRPDPVGAVRSGRADGPLLGGLGRQAHGDRRRPPREPGLASVRTRGRGGSRDLEVRRDGRFAEPPERGRIPANRHARSALGGRRRAARDPEGDRVGGLVARRQEPDGRADRFREDEARVPPGEGPLRDARVGQSPADLPGWELGRLHRPSGAARRRRPDRHGGSLRAA